MPEYYAVGDHTAAYCPTCQVRRDQTIVAMEGVRIATVTCTTCGRLAPFAPPAAAPKARASRATKGAALPPSVTARWEARMAAATGQEHQYTMTAQYRIGDIVLHEQFGKGVVLKLAPQKCLVLFQDQERLMASANGGNGVAWPLTGPRGPATCP